MGFKELFGLGIDKALDAAKGVVTTFVKDRGLQQQIDAEFQKLQVQLREKEMEQIQKMADLEQADKANARAMNIESMHSNDPVVRRFPVVLAGGIMLIALLCLAGLFFVEIPQSNRDLVNITIGSLITGGVTTVLGFYFGSSFRNNQQR